MEKKKKTPTFDKGHDAEDGNEEEGDAPRTMDAPLWITSARGKHLGKEAVGVATGIFEAIVAVKRSIECGVVFLAS